MPNFKIARLLKNKTQLQLQLETDIPQCRLSAIEKGYSKPKADEMEKLERALDLPGGIEWKRPERESKISQSILEFIKCTKKRGD